jgi:hypothetical protein
VTTFGTGVDDAVKRIARTYEVRGMLLKITSYDNAAVGSGSVLNEVGGLRGRDIIDFPATDCSSTVEQPPEGWYHGDFGFRGLGPWAPPGPCRKRMGGIPTHAIGPIRLGYSAARSTLPPTAVWKARE